MRSRRGRVEAHVPVERLKENAIDPRGSIDSIARSLRGMDAVVTIDNTTLHIAGAVGVKTFALLSVPSYWQWPATGEWSRWYDQVVLLRQEAPGHWIDPLAALDVHLAGLAQEVPQAQPH